jgi:hypothetical protein
MVEVTFTRPVTFPPSCIACGEPATRIRALRAVQGFHAIIAHYRRWVSVAIPLCRRCARRRFLASALIAPAAVLLGIVIPAFATAALAAGRISSSAQLAIVLAGLGWIALFANRGERWLDDWLLHVQAIRFSGEGQTITLRFRDEASARRVADVNAVVASKI